MTDRELEYMAKIRNRTLTSMQPKDRNGLRVSHYLCHSNWPCFFAGMMKHMGYEYDEKTEQYMRKEGESD